MEPLALAAVAARWAVYLGVALALGSALLRPAYADYPALQPLLRRQGLIGVGLGLLALALQLAQSLVALGGEGLASLADAELLGFLWRTPPLDAAALQAVGLLLCAVALWRRSGWPSALLAALPTAGAYALVGHSLAEPRLALATAIAVHTTATAVWLAGALALWQASGERTARPQLAAIAQHFATIATPVTAAVAASGLAFALWRLPLDWAFLGGDYGRVFVLKLLLVGAILAVAALNRWHLVPCLQQTADAHAATRTLRRVLAADLLLFASVLAATAALTAGVGLHTH